MGDGLSQAALKMSSNSDNSLPFCDFVAYDFTSSSSFFFGLETMKCVLYNCRGRVDNAGCILASVWRQEGISFKEIARRLRVHPKTAKRASLSQAAPVCRPPNRSRQRAERVAVLRTIVAHLLRAGTLFSSSDIVVALRKKRFSVSASTVRRDLNEIGLHAYKRPLGPKRHEGDAQRRLTFACSRMAPASSIWFSDEKIFDCNDHGQVFQWAPDRKSVKSRGRAKFSPRVHVWGMIGVGIRELVFLPEGKNLDAYGYKLHVLQRCLAPTWERHGSRATFMQDGARVHTAGACLRYLSNKGIPVLGNWPPRSPDLNPIENMWAIVQQEVSKKYTPKDIPQLKNAIERVWKAIPSHVVNNLVVSFEDRKKIVKKNKGE